MAFDVVVLSQGLVSAASCAVLAVTLSAASCVNVVPILNLTARMATNSSGAPVERFAGGALAAFTRLNVPKPGSY